MAKNLKPVLTAAALLAFGLSAPAHAASPPAYAAAAGYTQNTFSAFQLGSIDLGATDNSGYAWYPWHFFGKRAKTENIVPNMDGSVTFNGDVTGPNGELATATKTKNARKFVGTAFGGGGYFEASIKFAPIPMSSGGPRGWPSFWAMALEHLATGSDKWLGRSPDYEHFIEVDFLEYDISKETNPQPNYYGASMREWYGVYGSCGGNNVCNASRPYHDVRTFMGDSMDFSQYHAYGFLWVPATNSSMGYGQFYFDRQPVGNRISWTQFANQSGTPEGQPWQYGILDDQHLVVILGTGIGKPMTVRSVNVWQASDSQNLRN